MATTPDGGGYWLVAADGGVFAFGDASFYGSRGTRPYSPIVSVTATPERARLLVRSAGGVAFAFGDAGYYGSVAASGPHMVGMAQAVGTG